MSLLEFLLKYFLIYCTSQNIKKDILLLIQNLKLITFITNVLS